MQFYFSKDKLHIKGIFRDVHNTVKVKKALIKKDQTEHIFCLNKVFSLLFSLQAAKKFMDGKKTMAASGHLGNTPFVDEL